MSALTRCISTGLLCLCGQSQPPVSPYAVAAELKVSVERAPMPSTLPGFTARICGCWFVWLNSGHGPRRRRFTLAHELGHIALEHPGVVFLFSSPGSHLEHSADRFAAELLLPEKLVQAQYSGAVSAGLSCRDLADIFLVDPVVMELRLTELGLDF